MKEVSSGPIRRDNAKVPYVVSADVRGLMTRWTSENGLQLPKNGFFEEKTAELHDTLNGYFPGGVEIVDEREIKSGIMQMAERSENPIISLDRAYLTESTPDININGYIDLTRGVDENLNGIGLRERSGTPSKESQLESYRTKSPQPITLVDDVIFSGEGVVEIAKDLAAVNRPVDKIIAGIGIAGGIERIEEFGIEVATVRQYSQVIDEVCARDFYPGVPMSGRSVYASDGSNYSAPYIRPFGKPETWASIPEQHADDFSKARLGQAIEMWSEIERASGVKIPTNQAPRQLLGANDEQSIVYALKRHE